ncbi:hypothetical protein WJX72_010577 [[Myrmecia] bisecta]|uniref:Uncharacterized protein n=1 Tax=[Myrmecia] bisecta TaxID=41462 RepID=A0AAW1Q563_9CHLO
MKKKKSPLKQATKYAPIAAAVLVVCLIGGASVFVSKLSSASAKVKSLETQLEHMRVDYLRQKHTSEAHQAIINSRSHEAERLRTEIRTHTSAADGLRSDLKQAQERLAAKEDELKKTQDEVHALDVMLKAEKERSGHASACTTDLSVARLRSDELSRSLADKDHALVEVERRLAADTEYHYKKEREWEAARLQLEKDLADAKCDHPDHQNDPKPAAGSASLGSQAHSHSHGPATPTGVNTADGVAARGAANVAANAAGAGAGAPDASLPEAKPEFGMMASLLEDEGVFHRDGHAHMARLLTKVLGSGGAQGAHPAHPNLNTGTPLLDEKVAQTLAEAGVRDLNGLPHLIAALNRHYHYSLNTAVGRRDAPAGSADPGAGSANPNVQADAAQSPPSDQASEPQPVRDFKTPNTFTPPNQPPPPNLDQRYAHHQHVKRMSAADVALGGIPGLKNRHLGGHEQPAAGGAENSQQAQQGQPEPGEAVGGGNAGGGRHDMPAGRMGLH